MAGPRKPLSAEDLERHRVLRDMIRRLIEARATNAKKVSEDAGLANTFVSDILASRSLAPGLWPVVKIAQVLGVTVNDLIGQERGVEAGKKRTRVIRITEYDE